ncbi:MAG: metallophosphoesterase family protein [Myxococcales bacterium]|nr:metallophosphoesterase family protein [Myxococcales bacterium]
MRFLCLSDIHGHADALSAVLATAERTGYTRVLVAGDICFPGPAPLSTWRRLNQLQARCVQGVGDRAIATVDTSTFRPRDDFERARLRRLVDVRRELGDAILGQLAKLPRLLRQALPGGRQLTLVHGSPVDPLEPLTHDMDDETMAHLLGDEVADIVLCGGSHVPFDRLVPHARGGITRVINVGSVGEAPASSAAYAHGPRGEVAAWRGGRGHAHATFIEATNDGIDVQQFVVPLGRAA